MAALLGIERVGPRRLLGVILSVAGALVLADPRRFAAGSRVALGNVLIIGNVVCYAFFLVLQRPILRRLPWRTVIAWSFLFGGAATLPFALPAVASLRGSAVSAGAWLGVAYAVIFPTVLAYSISTWAVRRSSPALVAAYSALQPLVAAALAASFLGERLGWGEGLGFALIVAGLWGVSG